MKTVIEMAREVFDVTADGRGRETFSGDSFGLERFVELVRADEREAIIDLVAIYGGTVDLEAAIRARGNT